MAKNAWGDEIAPKEDARAESPLDWGDRPEAQRDLPAGVTPSTGRSSADPRRLDRAAVIREMDEATEAFSDPDQVRMRAPQARPGARMLPGVMEARPDLPIDEPRGDVPVQQPVTTVRASERPRPNRAEDLGRMAGDTGTVGRVASKISSSGAEGAWGVVRAGAELVGADKVAEVARGAGTAAQDFERGMGDPRAPTDFGPKSPVPYLQRMGEGAATSLGQSALYATTFGARAVIPLLSLQSAGQQYQTAREAGKTPGQALATAIPYGAFEALGEKFQGLDKAAKALNVIAGGRATRQQLKDAGQILIEAGVREIPGELVTYLGQSAVDVLPGIGIRQDLTTQQFLEGLRDTVVQSAMMGGAIGTGGAAARMRSAGQPAQRTPEEIARAKGFLVQQERIKQLNTAGEKEVAGVLQRRLDTEQAESELQALADRPYAGEPDFQQRYRTMRSQGVKPAEASSRAAMHSGFAQLAGQAGLTPKAVERAIEATAKMPLDEVPGFLERYTASLSQKGMGQPLPQGTVAGAVGGMGDDAMNAAIDNIAAILGVQAPAAGAADAAAVSPQAASVPENQPSVPLEPEFDAGNDVRVTPEADAVHAAATSPLNDLPEPTQAQKEAGNYKLGRLRIAGMDISIENPQGSVRRGTDADGKPWETPMRDHYGYVRGTTAADGDKLDVFVKPGTPEDYRGPVFVVDQIDPRTGRFDEHKVVLGAADQAEAEALYRRNYSADWNGLGAITQLPMPAFRSWAESNRTKEPLGDLSQVDAAAATGAEQPAAAAAPDAGAAPAGQAVQPAAAGHAADRADAVPAGAAPVAAVAEEVTKPAAEPVKSSQPAALPSDKAAPVNDESGGETAEVVTKPSASAAAPITFTRNPSGTLTVTGDEATIRRALEKSGITRVMAGKGGLLVGKTQAEAAEKALAKLASKRAAPAAAEKPAKEQPLSVGITPNSAEPVTVRDGVVFVGKHEALDFDSGEPVKVPQGATEAQIKRALQDAGAITRKQRFFGGGERAAALDEAPTAARAPATIPREPGMLGKLDFEPITGGDERGGTYTISPARYAKEKAKIEAPSTNGLKTRANRLAEKVSGGNWSNREKAYILSPAAAERFQRLYAEGWNVNLASGELVAPAGAKGDAFDQAMRHRAFHGTPHDFDEFTTEAIGSGEGAAAFGWGLYFAENEVVAESYRKKLTDHNRGDAAVWEFNDQRVVLNEWIRDAQERHPELTQAEARDAAFLASQFVLGARPTPKPENLKAAKLGRAITADMAGLKPVEGQLLEVEVPDDVVARMLLWDKPLSEQPEVLAAVKTLFKQRPEFGAKWSGPMLSPKNMTGREFYQTIAEDGQRAASEALDAAGVPGIRYLDGQSRNRPLKQIKREFLAELPEDADFDEVMDLIGSGTFSPQNQAILKELAANDWLGFDYPAQALSAALSQDLANYDASPELKKAVEDAQVDATFNLVVFNERNVKVTHKNGTPVTKAERDEFLEGARGRSDSAQRRSDEPMPSGLTMNEARAQIRAMRGISVAEAQKIVEQLTAKWKDGPKVHVVATAADLPGDNPPDVRGLYERGQVWIVAGAHRNGKDVRRSIARTLAHEAVAHFGLRDMLGREGWHQLMKNIRLATAQGNKPLREIQDHVRKTYTDAGGKFNLAPDLEADEIAARAVELAIDADGNFKPGFGFFKEVWAKVAKFLRDLGIDVTFTNAELQGMLVLSMRSMERGQRTAGGGQLAVAAAREDGPMHARTDRPLQVPEVIVATKLGTLNKHPDNAAAKAGDSAAAMRLAQDVVTPDLVQRVRDAIGQRTPTVVPVVAEEAVGRNKIPLAAAEVLADQLGLKTSTDIVQANRAHRTGKDGYYRILNPVDFDGPVQAGRDYLILDDTITQGGTLAALASHIREGGGNVISAVALTGFESSARIDLDPAVLTTLRQKHASLEDQFRAVAGHGFDALTNAEARYLIAQPPERLRDRLVAEGRSRSERLGESAAGKDQEGVGDAFDGTAQARAATTTSSTDSTSTAQAVPRPLSRWRDAHGRLQFAPGQVLYDLIGKAADPLLQALQLKAASPALRRALREMKNEVRKAQETAAAVAGESNKLSAAERAMVSDLIEKELAAGVVPPEHAVRLAALINDVMGKQTDELVRLGMLEEGSAEKWRGQYLPRFYESKLSRKATDAWTTAVNALRGRPKAMAGIRGKHLRGRGLYETIPEDQLANYEAMGWEVRDPDFTPGQPTTDGTVQVWRDFTRAERDAMGEIRDAGFRFVMGYMQTQRDIALGRMFEALAANAAISSRTETKEFSVQVPTSTVPGTGAKTYGKLAGRWVSKETLSHLSAIEEAQSEVLQMYRKAMGWWKLGKTAMNPVSHMNNVLSNLTMAHFAGVSYWEAHKYAAAVHDLATGAAMVKEAKDVGLFGGTMSEAELLNMLPPELAKLARTQEGLAPKVGRTAFDIMTFFLRRPMGWAYQAEDSFFRYLLYRDARGRGVEPAEAVDYAQRFIFAYDDLPKGARVIRDFGIPFFSYTYKAAPALLHTALTHPVRFAAPAAVLWGANAAAYAIAAGEDDEEWVDLLRKYLTDPEHRKKARELEQIDREHLPPWMRGTTALLSPKALRLGMDELTKLPLFIDTARIVPGGDLFDVSPNAGGLPIPQPLTPSHPLFTTAVAMIGNKDLFFGKEIVDSNDTRAEAAEKRAVWIWRQMAPAMAIGNYHWVRGMNALAQATGKSVTWLPDAMGGDATGIGRDGLPVQPHHAAMQTFGIKVRPIDIERSMEIEESLQKKMAREIDAEMRSLKRLHSIGAISDRAFDKADDLARTKKDRLKEGLTVDGEPKK